MKVLVLLFLFGQFASARDIYQFPDVAGKAMQKLSLSEITEVQQNNFSIVVPKGWSVHYAGENDTFKASLTATPTMNINGDETYIGVHVKNTLPTQTLEEMEIREERAGRKVSMQTWNNQKWLVTEFESNNSKSHIQKMWTATAITPTAEFIINAGTPLTKVKANKKRLQHIMESMVLR